MQFLGEQFFEDLTGYLPELLDLAIGKLIEEEALYLLLVGRRGPRDGRQAGVGKDGVNGSWSVRFGFASY